MTAAISTATTRLESVNAMLSVVGSLRVNSLAGTLDADTAMADAILTEVEREVQNKGWVWNTEEGVEIAQDPSTLKTSTPTNAFRVDPKPGRYDKQIVIRGSFLYDNKNRTFDIGSTITADVTYVREWEEMPEPARRYITIRAARIFNDRVLGAKENHAYTMNDEMAAWAALQREEMQTGDYSMLGSGLALEAISRQSPIPYVRR